MPSITRKYLIILFLTSFFLLPLVSINLSKPSQSFKENEDYILEASASEIIITTPESKIYTRPMHGYYPGANSFDNDKIGDEPAWFSEVNSDGGDVQVIENLEEHKSVLDLEDTNNSDNVFARRTFFSFPNHGTIEYWMRTDNADKSCGFRLDGGFVLAALIAIRTRDNQLQRYNGTNWINITTIENNKWYHIRIDFECSTGNYSGLSEYSWKLYLNGGLPYGIRTIRNIFNLYKTVEPFSFINNRSFADSAAWNTVEADNGYHYYIDAIGFSWDAFYNLNDNRNEGLFLDFQAPTNLTWIGYSLNGGSNRTILGNITIPKPVDSPNTLQVFGKDSLNIVYESSILSFEVENPTWLFLPGIKGGATDSGAAFTSSTFDMDQNGNSDFEDYYGSNRMIGISYYENTTSRPEFTGVNSSSSLLKMADAVKNFIITEYQAGNITDRIDLTGYSQGGVLARTIVKEHFYDLKKEGITIDHVAIIGSPCHGTWAYTAGYWKQQAEGTLDVNHPTMQMATVSDFMKYLNAEDETPFDIHYNTYRGIAAPSWEEPAPFEPYKDDYYEWMLFDIINSEAQNKTSIYNKTKIDHIAEDVGIYWDAAVVEGSVPLSGAVNNRLYNDLSHVTMVGNKEVFKDILTDYKHYPEAELSIETPQNKTYYNPTAGYYLATNGFECDKATYKPAWFDVINTVGGTVKVREELDGHKKVLEIHDTSIGLFNAHVRKLLSSNPTYGTVEYWMNSDDASKLCGFRIDDGLQLNEMINLRTFFNVLQYYNGTDWNNICFIQNNSWYHIRIDFACSTSGYESLGSYSWRIYVNGFQYGDYSFINNRNTASRLVWFNDYLHLMFGYKYYIDAIGLSWDPNYNVGDNLKYGFLVDIEKNFVHDWIQYSYDENPNVNILGDFLIPLPSEGLHSLQLFSQDWSGEQIESDIVFFSKDTAPPALEIYMPGQGNLFGVISPQFSLSVNETNLDSVWYSLDNGLTNISPIEFTGQIDQTEWNDFNNGTVNIVFYANNTLGELEHVEIIIRKDVINPVINIHKPLQDEVFGSTPPLYNISIDEPSGLDLVWFTFDGGLNNFTILELTGTINNTIWEQIPEGQVTLRIYAKDKAGNIGYTDITISKEPPKSSDAIPSYNTIFLIIAISLGTLLIWKKISINKIRLK
ncbi:MAG: hypothetical protein KGD58_09090 [Candidatus Lokiarchaeota archaeon]|nr:hypothetical protein [Candidatus Lokiarchaeota archaeon]